MLKVRVLQDWRQCAWAINPPSMEYIVMDELLHRLLMFISSIQGSDDSGTKRNSPGASKEMMPCCCLARVWCEAISKNDYTKRLPVLFRHGYESSLCSQTGQVY